MEKRCRARIAVNAKRWRFDARLVSISKAMFMLCKCVASARNQMRDAQSRVPS